MSIFQRKYEGTLTMPRRKPQNVRAILPTGDQLPLTVLYTGKDAFGLHTWTVNVSDSLLTQPGVEVHCDHLPPHHRLYVLGLVAITDWEKS